MDRGVRRTGGDEPARMPEVDSARGKPDNRAQRTPGQSARRVMREWHPSLEATCRTHGTERRESSTRSGAHRVETQQGDLRPDRVTLITRRIETKRAGASLKVRENDVRMALAGEDSLHTRCMALSLREIDEDELRAWIAQGLITGEELRRCRALNPRKR